MVKTLTSIGVTLALSLAAASAHAGATNLVQNGGFELTTNGPNYFTGYGLSELLDWSYNAAPAPNAAVYTYAGANGAGACRPDGCFPLYGPGNGFANGFSPSPAGGNFLASDAEAAYQGAFSQTINGLTPGATYRLSFVWAGNEYLDSTSLPYHGGLTADWQASLGAQTFTTPVATYQAHGFTGWMSESFTYTATGTSEVLSFLAQGGPNGLPPVALLDGVSLTQVPEPATWSLLGLGLVALGIGARWRTTRRA
jgi:hypothetical protein